MNAVKFLKEALINLVQELDFIQCQYEHDEFSSVHLIEIDCLDGRDSDEIIKIRKREIKRKFVRTFPLEGILFVTESSLNQLSHADFTFIGAAYGAAQNSWDYTVYNEIRKACSYEDTFTGREFSLFSVNGNYLSGQENALTNLPVTLFDVVVNKSQIQC